MIGCAPDEEKGLTMSRIHSQTGRRRYFIGGSDARIIIGNDEAALLQLWRKKRGEIEPEDLSGNLVVQLGVATEDLNRRWYEANTGQVITDIQKRVWHPALRWMAATLDGRVQGSDAVFEAKFMLPWSFSEEAAAEGAQRYNKLPPVTVPRWVWLRPDRQHLTPKHPQLCATNSSPA